MLRREKDEEGTIEVLASLDRHVFPLLNIVHSTDVLPDRSIGRLLLTAEFLRIVDKVFILNQNKPDNPNTFMQQIDKLWNIEGPTVQHLQMLTLTSLNVQ